MAYNNTYDLYIEVLATHTGWTQSYLSTYITNEYNLRQGIKHKGSTTPSDKHGIEGRKEWAEYDNTFPSYPCEGACTLSFMTPTSDHEINCGGPEDPSTSKIAGCRVNYYSCNPRDVAIHKPGSCITKKWHQTWNRGPNGESVPVWTLVDCGEWTRVCLTHMDGHASPAEPGNNNFLMWHTLNIYNDDGTIRTTTMEYNNLITEEQTIPSDSNQLCSACNETYTSSEESDHQLLSINSMSGYCTTHAFYACQSSDHISTGNCPYHTIYACDTVQHVEEQCTATNTNGDRCTYTFWRCVHPTVPSYGPSHTHTYHVTPSPAVFTPSLSLTYNSSTGSVSMTATASEAIYGADLYVRFPGDTSNYGTKIGWTSGNSDRTTYSLPVNYTFPSSPASGMYKFTLRVYPFNNSGSGNAWGTPSDVFKSITVQ